MTLSPDTPTPAPSPEPLTMTREREAALRGAGHPDLTNRIQLAVSGKMLYDALAELDATRARLAEAKRALVIAERRAVRLIERGDAAESRLSRALALVEEALDLLGCEGLSHLTVDRHSVGEPCPLIARLRARAAAIREGNDG